MSTIIISPTNYWQVDYGTVTQLNPEELVTSSPPDSEEAMNDLTNRRAVFIEFDIPNDATYRHAVVSGVKAAVNASVVDFNNFMYIFKNNGKDLALSLGDTVLNGGDDFSGAVAAQKTTPTYYSCIYPAINATNNKMYFCVVHHENRPLMRVIITSVNYELTYTDGTFLIEASKGSGYIPATIANTIKVLPVYFDTMLVQYQAVSGVFYYKKSSSSTYTSIAFNGDTVTIPANTFEEDEEYNYYFTAVADDGSTATSEVYTVSTGDVEGTVTALSPSNSVAYGSPNFAWAYENELGNQQTAFDLQISVDGTNWSDLASHEETPNTFYTASVPIGGLIYWRVRSYNQSDVATDWSNVLSFTNVMPPSAPTITSVTGNGRITVQWNAANQIAYQVMIGDYDSGWIYSTEKQYFYNEYLEDGTYEIKVRITNNIGLVSDWAELSYSQSGRLPGPAASVTMREGFNEILVSGSFDRYYIIRNGVVIAQIADGMYEDYYCNGNDSYIIRGVNNDDTFGDALLTGAYTCHKPALIDPDGTITYVNERLDEQPEITSSDTVDVAMMEYLGRSLPVHHVGQMQKRTWSVTCSAKIKPGQIYFYRNFRGDKAWVICANVQSSLNWFGVHEYQYTLEETDYDEAVGYAV